MTKSVQKYPKFGNSYFMNPESQQLSREEIEIFTNPIFFQRKNNITNTIIALLEKLDEQLENNSMVKQVITNFNLPLTRGKISKGENYLGYPWQILDYPRVFQKENIFAFRTLCWWGNFYSCTLHIGGMYYQNCDETISKKLNLLTDHQIYICINDKQWDHHHEENNYRLLSEVLNEKHLLDKVLSENNFIKLSCKFPLSQIEKIEENAMESFNMFSKIFV